MSNAVEARHPNQPAPMAEFSAHVAAVKPYLDRLLGDPDKVARFGATLAVVARGSADVRKCSGASIMGAALVCAQLDLEPGSTEHVWLIPRKLQGQHELTVMLGYKGMKALAERHPAISAIHTGTVREGDQFEHTAHPPDLRHTPDHSGAGDPYLWYAIAYRADGGHPHIAVLNRQQVEARRAHSAAKDNGPWKTHYDQMAEKSCIRALWKHLPSSLDLERASVVEDGTGVVTPQHLGAPASASPTPQLTPLAGRTDVDDDGVIQPEGSQDTQEGGQATTEHTPEGDATEGGDGASGHDAGRDAPEPAPRHADDQEQPPAREEVDDGAGARGGDGKAQGAPATDQQMLAIADLQARRTMDDHDMCEMVRELFGIDVDTVEAAIAALDEDQAGELIARLQGNTDEEPPDA